LHGVSPAHTRLSISATLRATGATGSAVDTRIIPLEIIGCWIPSILVNVVSIMAFASLEVKPEKKKRQPGYISKDQNLNVRF
jgi:hypothetical protein